MAAAPFAISEAPSAPELVAKYFRALGDPTRVRILELLCEGGELTVGELVVRLGSRSRKCRIILRACGGADSS